MPPFSFPKALIRIERALPAAILSMLAIILDIALYNIRLMLQQADGHPFAVTILTSVIWCGSIGLFLPLMLLVLRNGHSIAYTPVFFGFLLFGSIIAVILPAAPPPQLQAFQQLRPAMIKTVEQLRQAPFSFSETEPCVDLKPEAFEQLNKQDFAAITVCKMFKNAGKSSILEIYFQTRVGYRRILYSEDTNRLRAPDIGCPVYDVIEVHWYRCDDPPPSGIIAF